MEERERAQKKQKQLVILFVCGAVEFSFLFYSLCVWVCICNLNKIAGRIEFSFYLSRANTLTRFTLSTVFFLLNFILFLAPFLPLSHSQSHSVFHLVLFRVVLCCVVSRLVTSRHLSRLKRCSCICLFVCLSRFVYRVCLLREWQIKCVFFYCAIVKCLSFSLPPLVCVRICLLLLTYLLTYSLLFCFVAFHPMLLFCLLWFDIFSRIKIKSLKFRKRLELERICYCNFGKKKTGSFNWSEFNIIT